MVDFKKLREAKQKPVATHPRDIFNGLPKPPGINDLYASQAEVLDAWYLRRTERDLVIKLHTGGGKTLVALLMAQSVMNEHGEPVVYLAPTVQLVEQVIAKSKAYGMPAVPYKKGQPLPIEFYDGKSVLVCTYEALFNGRSKFGVRGGGEVVAAGAIILDDAHVALTSVRDAFSLTISSSSHKEVYSELTNRFRASFREVGRGGTFDDVVRGKDFGILEVPSWGWLGKVDEIQDYLGAEVDQIDNFVWPFLRDNLPSCHCLVSRRSVTITPIFPPVDLVPTFEDCGRRIYMSATIADDSEIVRTFGASAEAIGDPLTSASLAGVGERMILVPELMKLGNTTIEPMVKSVATKLSQRRVGAAILVPSGAAAERWTDIAQYASSSKEVSECVKRMQEGGFFGPLVLANRYDGIDLANDACRFLVLDGLPRGTSDYDMFRANVVAGTAVNTLLAQRIEQGIGRGTRGAGDYCVVVLMGRNLVGWIGRKTNLAFLTSSTRVQLKMGQDISAEVTTNKEFGETILKCLKRDPDWVGYHASELTEAAQLVPAAKDALHVAGGERRAFRLQRLGKFAQAIQTLEDLAEDVALVDDPHRRAWLSATAARIAYQLGDHPRGQAFQTTAFNLNNNHTPPTVRPVYVPRPKPGQQSEAIVALILGYDRRRALLADFEEAVAGLTADASSDRFEQGLADLGTYLGFEAERPDKIHNVGPDVLWRTEAPFDFIIEAKSEKDEGNPLYKRDHAQLLEAESWFKGTYPDRGVVRVSALPQAIAHAKASPAGTKALRLADLSKLVGALRRVLTELVGSDEDVDGLHARCEAALVKLKLKPNEIVATFLTDFAKTGRSK